MILNIYKWLLVELEKEGYKESDIVLFQDALACKYFPAGVVKQCLNKDVSVSTEDAVFIVVTGPLMIHLTDGTIVEYSNEQDDHDLQEYANSLTYYFSAQRLLAKETPTNEKPEIGLVVEEGYKGWTGGMYVSDDHLLNHCHSAGLIALDVKLKETEEVQDFYTLTNRLESLITLDVEASKLYIDTGTIKEADVDKVIEYILKLPIIADSKLVNDITNKFNHLNSNDHKQLIYFDSDELVDGLSKPTDNK